MRDSLLFTFFLLCSSVASSQYLTGVIVDSLTREPLFGATVLIGEQGTSTNIDGSFSLYVPADKDDVIVKFSYVGYKTRTKTFTRTAIEESQYILLIASDNLLETAVITGSKYEQRVAESVVSIDVIKPDLLMNTNTTSLDQIFTKIPGVQMLEGQPNIRGGSGWAYNSGNRVLVLLDEIPALQPDAGRALWSDMPVENVSQIEVIKGAGSALYGSSAMNGVINIRTSYPTSTPETHISVFHTRFDNYTDSRKNWYSHTPQNFGFSATHKRKIGKLDLVSSLFYSKQDSTKTFREQDFNEKFRISTNLRYRISDKVVAGVNTILNVGASSSFFLWRNGSTGALQPFDGTVTTSRNQRYLIDPYLTIYDKKDNRHRVQGRVFYINNDNNLDQSNQSIFGYLEYQFQRRWPALGLTMSTGLLGSYTESKSELFANAELNHLNSAAYLQLDKVFGARFNVSGGLRYEYNEQRNGLITYPLLVVPQGEVSEGRMVGRLGANYQVSEGTFVRASYGQGYRFPVMIERYLSTAFGGFAILPNPSLRSETGFTTEVGLKQGFRIAGLEGFVDISGFLQQYDNMMEFVFVNDPQIGFKSLNIGDTEIRGAELGIGARAKLLGVPLNINGGYSYIDPTYRNFNETISESSSTDENVLKYRTRSSYTMDIQSEIGAFMAGASILGASHMLAIDDILETFIPDLRAYRRLNSNGFRVLDARVGYTYQSVRLSMHLKNILNTEYTMRPGLIEPPRNFALRLDFQL